MTTVVVPTGRGALRRTGRTRRQRDLLDGLQALFLAEGFAPFTLDDLANHLHCSKTTLYALAPSKEQLAVAVARHYFKNAAERIEAKIADETDLPLRIGSYLAGIGEEMRGASAEFIADLNAFEPTREVYERNTRAAAERIRGFAAEGIAAGVFHEMHTAFLAETVGATIAAIQRGDLRRRTGLSEAEAFAELSNFVVRALLANAGPQGAAA